jgi:hypothetical protein
MTIRPPVPEDADRLFAGLETTPERLRRFVEEVSSFYQRAWRPLEVGRRDRSRVPELDEGLREVEAALESLARAALVTEGPEEAKVQLVLALTDVNVWKSLRDHGVSEDAAPMILSALLKCLLVESK